MVSSAILLIIIRKKIRNRPRRDFNINIQNDNNLRRNFNREFRSALIIMCLDGLHCLLFLPLFIFWTLSFMSFLGGDLQELFSILAKVSMSLAVIVYGWKLYLYLFLIKEFRQSFVSFVRFRGF